MNLDNQRLKEVKEMLSVYYHELDKADTISKSLKLQEEIDKLEAEKKQIQAHIDELELEEKQILKRCNVII